MNDRPSHGRQYRPAPLKRFDIASDHEGQARRFGSDHAARDRCVEHVELGSRRGGCDRARGLDIDRRAIDQ